jgi:hypothetical protein
MAVHALQEDVVDDLRNIPNSFDMGIKRIHDSTTNLRRC